ncbi:MAG: adenylyltransferase/cytidyltransferase family protein [Candidatus Kerfeldbacteria bacterium]|nr:adenylyltransferase/cytidyltransferase family protein [Candidatus Kerfeldbacteria bacterium]
MRQGSKKRVKPVKVLVFGVFDLLHQGHKHFLRQASRQGQQLVVVVARDKVVSKIKKLKPQQNQVTRLRNIKKLPFVQTARWGDQIKRHQYHMIKLIKPDIVCLGYDQKPNLKQVKQELQKAGLKPKFIRLKAYQPHKFKSSLIKTLSENTSAHGQ